MKVSILKFSTFSKVLAATMILTVSSIKVIGCSSQNSNESSVDNISESMESTPANSVVVLDGSNFSKTIEKGIVLVDFWAPWCGPCRVQIPIIEELAKEVGNKAVITKVNVDNNRPIAQQFNIRSIPTLLLFKDGKVVRTFLGVTQKNVLMAAINELM